jgi:hypothetical protein
MVQGGESAKPRLDGPLVGKGRDSQETVKVARTLDLIEALIQCVEQICSYDEDKDATAVLGIPRGRRLRARIACTDGEAIVDVMKNRGDIL